ncbi:hypothetical protein [Leptospira ellisii]|uniref:hypothetical protein n=1 Tax=Leptospira ellisii TaxID=2023197 RepID=UPI001FAFB450|nr:hypothetical protein [Leptospira ellisii]
MFEEPESEPPELEPEPEFVLGVEPELEPEFEALESVPVEEPEEFEFPEFGEEEPEEPLPFPVLSTMITVPPFEAVAVSELAPEVVEVCDPGFNKNNKGQRVPFFL